MAASRLLNNYFGSSQVVWAVLIGLVLIYLTVGYYVGGRLADRCPYSWALFRLLAWAGLLVGLIPFAAQPILRYGQVGLERYAAGLLAGSLFGVLALFALPVILLGCVSPFVTRLALSDVSSAGSVAGRVYAVSTAGSIGGAFLPPLLLIPAIGTKYTFLLMSAALLLLGLGGLASFGGLRPLYGIFPLAVAALLVLMPGGVVKAVPGMIYETESPYNYIQVVQEGDSRYLYLNEGQGVHSFYSPSTLLTGSVWDLFLVVPLFNEPPFTSDQVQRMCLIGLAAGTVARQYTEVYGPIPIDGVEIDPQVIEVGRRFFGMTMPNLNPVAQDGRYFLASSPASYDVIAVDAYRPPYIPPHLTTVEFFAEARAHLSERGVVAINVGRTLADRSLVNVLAATMSQVFPSVYVVDMPSHSGGMSNSLVVGTKQVTELSHFAANASTVEKLELRFVADRVSPWVRESRGESLVFTDDRAPVEQVVHRLIMRFLMEPLSTG